MAGWLWFLASLLPVLGIIQMGTDRHADRYTYFPGIGLALALCWSVAGMGAETGGGGGPGRAGGDAGEAAHSGAGGGGDRAAVQRDLQPMLHLAK